MVDTNRFDIIVIGGGHAGVEAASAATRMGMNTALLTSSVSAICKPSCNPNIGGTAKGHITKEIDALGGVQALLADRCGIHFKMLNKSKGPAIWSPRAQIDKDLYPKLTYQYLLSLNDDEHHLTIIEDTATEILVEHSKVKGCVTLRNETLYAKAIVLCAGTFLNGKLFIGQEVFYGGRMNEPPAEKISDLLTAFGLEKGRLKTGTPPRILNSSIDYSNLAQEVGDEPPIPFSYQTKSVKNQIVCYATATNERTHAILRTGFDRSPMFTGMIEGTGPRYCPSIEDKINRFSQRDSHKILLEPEGLHTDSIYVNGYSTSLPRDVQLEGLHSIAGLEHCKILSAGYAVEYDYFYPHQNYFSLETKAIEGLFFAGQINGTSGYEEAAGQGLIAGINAVLKVQEKPPFALKRSEAYIGVLIDDLVNKSTKEPYRMFTSLAEYRLLLRQDNAAERLAKYGYEFGLIPQWYYEQVQAQHDLLTQAQNDAKHLKLRSEWLNPYFAKIGEPMTNESIYLDSLLRRGKVELRDVIANVLDDNEDIALSGSLAEVCANAELAWKLGVEVKYEGYITKQKREVEYFLENENKRIPDNFNYDNLQSISQEAKQKLKLIRPASIGQASRISGISATDIAIISFYLRNSTNSD